MRVFKFVTQAIMARQRKYHSLNKEQLRRTLQTFGLLKYLTRALWEIF